MKKIITSISLLVLSTVSAAAELQFNFNSPAFNGNGYGTYVLTIKQLEDQAVSNNKAAADALAAKAKAEAANTPQAQFVANLQSRIYAQLAKQLTDSLFGTTGAPSCTAATAGSICGSIPDLAGNAVTWKLGVGSDQGMIIITIANLSDPSQTTTMKIPSGTFAFYGTNMIRKIIPLITLTALLGGCATGEALKQKLGRGEYEDPVVEQSKMLQKENWSVQPPQGGPIPVAVYNFRDLTGQRKQQPNVASLSSAVTQGADALLVKALQDVGSGRWFTVLERGGVENLIKERQMIRQMRELYQGKDAKPLPPMMFAGILLEGGIVGYDSNTLTGGAGVRIFGIGGSTQYQSDTVTVNLRAVSVSTGEVLTSVTVTKTVLSYMDKITLLRFINDGTNSVEGEVGGSINESINKATSLAVQAAVVDTIREGARKGHWAFKVEEAKKD